MHAQNILIGAYAGLTGGVVSGSLMGINNTLQMFGQTTLTRSTGIDFVIHMAISIAIGISFREGFMASPVVWGGVLSTAGCGGFWVR